MIRGFVVLVCAQERRGCLPIRQSGLVQPRLYSGRARQERMRLSIRGKIERHQCVTDRVVAIRLVLARHLLVVHLAIFLWNKYKIDKCASRASGSRLLTLTLLLLLLLKSREWSIPIVVIYINRQSCCCDCYRRKPLLI